LSIRDRGFDERVYLSALQLILLNRQLAQFFGFPGTRCGARFRKLEAREPRAVNLHNEIDDASADSRLRLREFFPLFAPCFAVGRAREQGGNEQYTCKCARAVSGSELDVGSPRSRFLRSSRTGSELNLSRRSLDMIDMQSFMWVVQRNFEPSALEQAD